MCLLTTAGAWSQEREPTVEELFLRDIEFQVLKEQAFQGDHDLKLSVLDTLEEKIESGEMTKDDIQLQFVLEYLSLEGTGIRIREGRTLVDNYPLVRRRATQLLGELASENSIPTGLQPVYAWPRSSRYPST